jgi:hypothetical protein
MSWSVSLTILAQHSNVVTGHLSTLVSWMKLHAAQWGKIAPLQWRGAQMRSLGSFHQQLA